MYHHISSYIIEYLERLRNSPDRKCRRTVLHGGRFIKTTFVVLEVQRIPGEIHEGREAEHKAGR